MSIDIPNGSEFPDLGKANLQLKLENIVRNIQSKDTEFFQLAQDKKKELNKQRAIDLKSFWESQSEAIERGNSNSCNNRNILDRYREGENNKVLPIIIPSANPKKHFGSKKNQTKLPKTKTSSPSNGNRSLPRSILKLPINQLLPAAIDTNKHIVNVIDPTNYAEKSERNMGQFIKAQAGNRNTSIGDRALVFTANGTPMYGDSYLDKNAQENLSANQATSNLPISIIPKQVKADGKISARGLQQQPRANIAPKSDSVGNMLLLGGIAAAVSAVLFLFQYVLMFVQLILQISSVTSTITNIAGSFVAILNNVGSLFGLGEGVIDPLSKTMDSILNNTFGIDKVDYVKYQFAKVSSAFVAGQNLLNKVTGLNNTIGKVAENNANNTSKIGNALKAMQLIPDSDPWMDEDNKVSSGISNLGTSLESVSGLASSLSEITSDVKTAKDAQSQLDKDYKSKQKESKEAVEKAKDKHTDLDIPDLAKLLGDLS